MSSKTFKTFLGQFFNTAILMILTNTRLSTGTGLDGVVYNLTQG